jgi:hypothetical protein
MYDDYEINLEVFDTDNNAYEHDNERMIERYFGKLGYGKKMEQKLVEGQMLDNRVKGKPEILTDENIANIENKIKKRKRDLIDIDSIEDKHYMRNLISRANRIKTKLEKRKKGGMRRRSVRKRRTNKKKRTTRNKRRGVRTRKA